MKNILVIAALICSSNAVSLEPTLVEVDGNSERFKIASSRRHKAEEPESVEEMENNRHKTTLTIVQDFPKKQAEPIASVDLVDIEAYDVEVIDHNDN